VIGPLMLAKHLAPPMNPGGSFVLFSLHVDGASR
jgi:hypothetical protein